VGSTLSGAIFRNLGIETAYCDNLAIQPASGTQGEQTDGEGEI
jgi:hypothetical protein